MPYRLFTAGEEALAADVNTLYMAQTVARFPSAANRAANLVAPLLNQLSILDDRPAIIQAWNGSAWVDATTIAGTSGFPPFIQWGSSVVATDPFGSANISFPAAFANANRAVMAMNGDANTTSAPYSFWVGILNPANTAAGFTAACMNTAGPINSVVVRINWLAIGIRP